MNSEAITRIPLDSIIANPNQPRKEFPEAAHDDSSIERNRQPTVLDNSVLASGLVSAGLSRGARPRVFTPSAINTIRGLAGQGKSASEIAEVIGSTTGSVRVKCSQLKIKLRRQGERGQWQGRG